MNGIKEMSETANKATREQLEANIKISHNWKTAVASGTFAGAQALHIATLLDFLANENAKAVKVYESEFPADVQWNQSGKGPVG